MSTSDTKPPEERILMTERFALEPLVQGHADEVFYGLSTPALYTFIPDEPPESLDVLRARFRRWEPRRSDSNDEIWLNYAVRDKATGEVVGTLQATILKAGFAYIAYFVFVRHWGRGVASETCSELVRFLFETFDLVRVLAHVDTRNERSIQMLRGLNFRLVETIQSADTFKGHVSDEYVFELTKVAWLAALPRPRN